MPAELWLSDLQASNLRKRGLSLTGSLRFTVYKSLSQALAAPLRRNEGRGFGPRAQFYFLVEMQEGVTPRLGTTQVSALGPCQAQRDKARSGGPVCL